MPRDFLEDPLWYKDAVIYELHVRSFFDANNDGYGDFAGLRQKLPYLERLGVNTLWLLPFLESPLRDDGYDTSDYYSVLPVHGSLDDFKAFLAEAHNRGMRVITELVLNHTSDQHPWFQEARDPSSPRHDWYVWSETADKYPGVRIIFTDTEVSNWSWDQKAQKYYWHRFFSHQPDLNYDNPDVREAMKEVMFFWLDMGVDGLRLDAVPYLFEREGTNCENLPETIDYIVELRAAIEERYGPGKVLLAEANQWPEDTIPYFADGKGVQMSFNFPIMPRIYMALRRENRRPLVEMLDLTSDIPEECQWTLFLRNHDELTLEMVTDEERDYMYNEYAADQRFRINVGIRRRLAPLLGGDRQQIELLNALLLSLPGSPVLYYGDEINMGDDPFLGDRNGVRTPMQWSPDKNGGFSRAQHHQLFMPAIHHGPYSYEFVNVEDAEAHPHSLLHFIRRMLAFRRQHGRAFGRGSMRVLPLENQAVLAFVREHEDEVVLVIANLSRFAQSAFIPPLEDLQGLVPVELFSQSAFPVIGENPYHLPMAPHGFYWFSLVPEEEMVRERTSKMIPLADMETTGELPVLSVPEGLMNLVVTTMAAGREMEALEGLLPGYMMNQRWFGAKGEGVTSVSIADAVRIQASPDPIYLTLLDVRLGDRTDRYLLPLATASGDEASSILDSRPSAAVAWLDTPDGRALLFDATAKADFWVALYSWWQRGGKNRSLRGTYAGDLASGLLGSRAAEARLLTGEQSNSAAILTTDRGDSLFVKLYRRLEHGTNPEVELLGHLTQTGFRFVPRLLGTASIRRASEEFAMGVIQEALPVEGDGWDFATAKVDLFLDRVANTIPPHDDEPDLDGIVNEEDIHVPAWLDEMAPELLEMARTLGVRTAEMHIAFSEADEPAIAPVDGSSEDTHDLAQRVREEAAQTRAMLDEHASSLPGLPRDQDWDVANSALDNLSGVDAIRQKIRIHGDYHLGQTLIADGEFYILDFEGEPARSLEERRRHDYALRDVAGMLRSLDYAAFAPLLEMEDPDEDLEEWAEALVRWLEAIFLDAYLRTAEDADFLLPTSARRPLLWTYLLDKALYEVRYELNHRPSWTRLPLRSLRRLLRDSREAVPSGA
jgi:maltose alpha-D-glucosyltransferase / alpha-amylase